MKERGRFCTVVEKRQVPRRPGPEGETPRARTTEDFVSLGMVTKATWL